MSFVEPTTIKEAIENIHKKMYLLPAIQREFVWKPEQIEKLFDSLMRDYPISTFLFWEVDRSKAENYQFYEFVRDYHERDNKHNPKANVNGDSSIVAILDGQQRLTSLYIGLKGSYAYKLPRKRWDNDDAFPKRRLCVNIASGSEDDDTEFDFKFLTDEESRRKNNSECWFVVGNILNFKETYEVNDYIINHVDRNNDVQFKFANRTLFKLYDAVNNAKSINFFLEKGESLDKVLNIFIRVNSGGTQLSYSDLLLSIATAQWNEKDAREEITNFVDEINGVGDGYGFNKDFVLKSCLVVGGFKEIAFKVDNFNKKNMLEIERQWESISESIKAAVVLVSNIGYHRDTLTSSNAIIPIANYIKQIGCPVNFSEASRFEKDRQLIFKWLAIVLLKRVFGGQPDNVLRTIRDSITKNASGFPFDSISKNLSKVHKSISFDNDDIVNLLYLEYGKPYTYSALSLIYQSLDFRNKFHQDHIFPKKYFTVSRLKKHGIKSSDIEYYMENFNRIGNLQLLKGIPNQEKSSKHFKEWLKEKFPTKDKRGTYLETHYIPNVDFSFENFKEFIEEREQLLTKAFSKLLL